MCTWIWYLLWRGDQRLHFSHPSHLPPKLNHTYSAIISIIQILPRLPQSSPCTKANIIFPAQSQRKLLPPRGTPWEACAEPTSCLVNPKSQAQLLKMVTDVQSSSTCAAVSTAHLPAPSTDKSLPVLPKPAAPAAPLQQQLLLLLQPGFTQAAEQDKLLSGAESGGWGLLWLGFCLITRAQPPRVQSNCRVRKLPVLKGSEKP